MFSHIVIGARDLVTMVAFYDAVLAPLDLRRVVELADVDEAGVIWHKGDRRWPQFSLRRQSMVCRQRGATACKSVSQHRREEPSIMPGPQRSRGVHMMKGRPV